MTVLSYGEIQIFPHTRKVNVQGAETRLMRKEFDILYYLITNQGVIALTTRTIDLKVTRYMRGVFPPINYDSPDIFHAWVKRAGAVVFIIQGEPRRIIAV